MVRITIHRPGGSDANDIIIESETKRAAFAEIIEHLYPFKWLPFIVTVEMPVTSKQPERLFSFGIRCDWIAELMSEYVPDYFDTGDYEEYDPFDFTIGDLT